MKMYPDDWQVKLTSGLISAACIVAASMLVGAIRFWPFILSIVVATIVGNLLGPLVCRLLFRSSSGGPQEKEKKDEKM
ncbi:MAG: hypothetical protein K9N62_19320 [Verrucomicrobia bacterium]|jgi:predicted PurR-regulated permease PerM|nr:hypothetical protein [Verrucomicrobiota bacterium]